MQTALIWIQNTASNPSFSCTSPYSNVPLPRRQAACRAAPEPEEAGQPDAPQAGGMDAAPQAHHDAAPGKGRFWGKVVTIIFTKSWFFLVNKSKFCKYSLNSLVYFFVYEIVLYTKFCRYECKFAFYKAYMCTNLLLLNLNFALPNEICVKLL